MCFIDRHFPPHHKLHQLFNKNNINISYSCLTIITSIINAHNRKILYHSPTISRRTCNCINIPHCRLQQKCLSNNILYQANITLLGKNSEPKFTTVFMKQHLKSLNHRDRNRKSDTELSNDIWKIKDNKRGASITWEILGRHKPYNTSSKRCSLCLNEKLKIALHRNSNMKIM